MKLPWYTSSLSKLAKWTILSNSEHNLKYLLPFMLEKNKFTLSYFKLHWNTATNYDQMDKGALTYIALTLEVIDLFSKYDKKKTGTKHNIEYLWHLCFRSILPSLRDGGERKKHMDATNLSFSEWPIMAFTELILTRP